MKLAYGFIETAGLAAAITASDILLKAANIKLIGLELTKGFGYTVVKTEGNVSAVKAGMDACSASPELLGKIVSISIIPRPMDNIDLMVKNDENNWFSKDTQKSVEEPEENHALEKDEVETKEIVESQEVEEVVDEVEIVEEPENDKLSTSELKEMRVVDLRKLAREIETSIPRSEIKYANKKELVKAIGAYYKSLNSEDK